jgi:hypothetical protein
LDKAVFYCADKKESEYTNMALISKKSLGLIDISGMFESDEFVKMVLIIAHFQTKTTQ